MGKDMNGTQGIEKKAVRKRKAVVDANGKILNAINLLKGKGGEATAVIPQWASDPERQRTLKMVVRAAGDFGKLDVAMQNRTRSPVEGVNDVDLLGGDQALLYYMGVAFGDMREAIQKSMKYLVAQSEIGMWLMAQPGLGSGWLAGYVLAEFPDVYDAGICVRCGTHLHRQGDGTYVHPVLPKKFHEEEGDLPEGEEQGESEEIPIAGEGGKAKGKKAPRNPTPWEGPSWDGVPVFARGCPVQGYIVPVGQYRIHERKPSTFARYAGISTEPSFACPVCNRNLRYDGKRKVWTHPKYTIYPTGFDRCPHVGEAFRNKMEDGTPLIKRRDGALVPAVPRRVSPHRTVGQALSYNSQLRSKLLGQKEVVDQFVTQRHPKYRAIYDGVKNRIAQRDPWRPLGHIDMMARRAVAYRFIVDFFTEWRRCEGLPCRKPYEEEYLGIRHHEDYVPEG